jgi:hypothetical protein
MKYRFLQMKPQYHTTVILRNTTAFAFQTFSREILEMSVLPQLGTALNLRM